MCLLLIPAGSVLAQPSGGVVLTAEPAYLGMSVTPETHNFGLLQASQSSYTSGGTFVLTNDGSVLCDVNVSGADMIGGETTWVLGAAPGDAIYSMYINMGEGFDTSVLAAPTKIVSTLLRQGSASFDLQLLAPTSNLGTDVLEGSITVTAVEASTVDWTYIDQSGGIILVTDAWRVGINKLYVVFDLNVSISDGYGIICVADGVELTSPHEYPWGAAGATTGAVKIFTGDVSGVDGTIPIVTIYGQKPYVGLP